jgi:hypothetical protein
LARDPPPPDGITLPLFFLMLGAVMLMTVAIDPTGALIAPEVVAQGRQREVVTSLAVGSGLIGFGGFLLFVAYKRAGKRPLRWVCRRCGALVNIGS